MDHIPVRRVGPYPHTRTLPAVRQECAPYTIIPLCVSVGDDAN